MKAEFLPCGDTGLTVQLGDSIDRELSSKIMCLRHLVEGQLFDGVIETVPTYRSLTFHYDPLLTSQAELVDRLEPLLAHLKDQEATGGSHFRFPVCFETKEFAPDLQHVAKWAKMSPEEVVSIMTKTPLFVYMLGFAPGQAHMGDLPESLAIPRRKNPVPGVKRGSLVIATGLAVIYPVDNPTGWHIIGRSPIRLFDKDADRPILLSPGDTVSLKPVSALEYHDIDGSIEAGIYTPERIEP